MVTAAGRLPVSPERTNPSGVPQGQGRAAPGATAHTQLGRMSVQLLSATTIEARSHSSALQLEVTQSAKRDVLLHSLDTSPGPEPLSGALRQVNPFSRTDVLAESANSLAGGSDVGRSLLNGASVTHVNPQDVAVPVLGASVVISGVGILAGGMAIRQAHLKVKKLEAQLRELPASSGDRTPEQADKAARLEAQIKESIDGRKLTIGVVSTSVALGLAGGTSAALGSTLAAGVFGSLLSGVTVGLSFMGAKADAKQIEDQRAANQKLSAGFETLQQTTPTNLSDKQSLLDSLENVAKHAQTAGKSRVKGKWASMAYNILTGFSGVVGLVSKVMVIAGASAGAVAVASSVLLFSGGAVLVAGAAFATYKYVRYKQNQSQAAKTLIQNPAVGSPEMAAHQKLMATNKHYAVRQLVMDIQTGRDDRPRTLKYLVAALGVEKEQAGKLIRLLMSEEGHAEGTQILSNALFRGKPISV